MRFITIFIAIMFIVSCTNEPINNDHGIEELKIDKLYSLLPLSELKDKSKIIYSAENGDEVTMIYEILENKKTKMIDQKPYVAEEISINLTDIDSDEYSLYILGSGNYLEKDKSNLFISCGLKQFITGYSPLITISEDGDAILALFKQKMNIAGREFEDVFMNYPVEGQEGYSAIYYNKRYGVVGFVNRDGLLFSLKEVID